MRKAQTPKRVTLALRDGSLHVKGRQRLEGRRNEACGRIFCHHSCAQVSRTGWRGGIAASSERYCRVDSCADLHVAAPLLYSFGLLAFLVIGFVLVAIGSVVTVFGFVFLVIAFALQAGAGSIACQPTA